MYVKYCIVNNLFMLIYGPLNLIVHIRAKSSLLYAMFIPRIMSQDYNKFCINFISKDETFFDMLAPTFLFIVSLIFLLRYPSF